MHIYAYPRYEHRELHVGGGKRTGEGGGGGGGGVSDKQTNVTSIQTKNT